MFTFLLSTIVMAVLTIPVFIFPDKLMALFTVDDMAVVEIGRVALRLQCIGLILIPLNTVCNMTYQVIGKSWTATFLSCLRQGLFFLPMILILPNVWGLFGLQAAQPVADFFAGAICIPFAVSFLKKIKQKNARNE